ncbi:MAG: hypothetical protein M1816_004117 [Peltula sp. TS41687]|nr:MAG: hypothetical protein M1816_004117 [Peltula sp. TS41687]
MYFYSGVDILRCKSLTSTFFVHLTVHPSTVPVHIDIRAAAGVAATAVGLGEWREEKRSEEARRRRFHDLPRPSQQQQQRTTSQADKGMFLIQKSDGTLVWITNEQQRKMSACLVLMRAVEEIWDQCVEYGMDPDMTVTDLDFGPTETGKRLKAEGKLTEWAPEEDDENTSNDDGGHHDDPSINAMVVDKVKTLRQNLQRLGTNISGAVGAVEEKKKKKKKNNKGGVVGAPGGGLLRTTAPMPINF